MEPVQVSFIRYGPDHVFIEVIGGPSSGAVELRLGELAEYFEQRARHGAVPQFEALFWPPLRAESASFAECQEGYVLIAVDALSAAVPIAELDQFFRDPGPPLSEIEITLW